MTYFEQGSWQRIWGWRWRGRSRPLQTQCPDNAISGWGDYRHHDVSVLPGAASISQMPADAAASSGIFGTPAGAKVTRWTQGAMDAVTNPYTLGSLGAAGIMEAMRPPETDFKGLDDGPSAPEAEAAKRRAMTPDEDYRPGIDPEFRFFEPMQAGGLAALKYQEGGEMTGPNDKELISSAVKAIKGQSEEPQKVLGMFLARYGEEALRDLVERAASGEFDQNAMVDEGIVEWCR